MNGYFWNSISVDENRSMCFETHFYKCENILKYRNDIIIIRLKYFYNLHQVKQSRRFSRFSTDSLLFNFWKAKFCRTLLFIRRNTKYEHSHKVGNVHCKCVFGVCERKLLRFGEVNIEGEW